MVLPKLDDCIVIMHEDYVDIQGIQFPQYCLQGASRDYDQFPKGIRLKLQKYQKWTHEYGN